MGHPLTRQTHMHAYSKRSKLRRHAKNCLSLVSNRVSLLALSGHASHASCQGSTAEDQFVQGMLQLASYAYRNLAYVASSHETTAAEIGVACTR